MNKEARKYIVKNNKKNFTLTRTSFLIFGLFLYCKISFVGTVTYFLKVQYYFFKIINLPPDVLTIYCRYYHLLMLKAFDISKQIYFFVTKIVQMFTFCLYSVNHNFNFIIVSIFILNHYWFESKEVNIVWMIFQTSYNKPA